LGEHAAAEALVGSPAPESAAPTTASRWVLDETNQWTRAQGPHSKGQGKGSAPPSYLATFGPHGTHLGSSYLQSHSPEPVERPPDVQYVYTSAPVEGRRVGESFSAPSPLRF
jgi:hypothetical protein